MIPRDQLIHLETRGWRITRDGSTATARFNWDDPDADQASWEVLVLHTAGHPNRFSLDTEALSERTGAELQVLRQVLTEAELLLADWTGELPDENEA